MANNLPNKVKIPVARPRSSEMDLSYDCYTTSDFFKNSIICCKEMVPGDKFDSIHVESFARTAPLAVPTFGQMKLKTHAFFVPFRLLMKNFNDFITQVPSFNSTMITTVPRIQSNAFVSLFSGTGFSTTVGSSSEDYDITFVLSGSSGASISKRKFTDRGRRAYDILIGLGYNLTWDQRDTTLVSMLPILAYAKIFLDWFYPAQYYLDSKVPQYFDTINKTFTSSELGQIMNELLYLTYEKDFYNQIWENPVAPNSNGLASVLPTNRIIDPTNESDDPDTIIQQTTNIGTPQISSSETNLSSLSSFALRALNSLTAFVERNRLAGFRPMERFLARFGVKLSDAKLSRSVFIGSQEQTIQVSDVTSTADTLPSSGSTGAPLGAQAGKGVVYDRGNNWSFETDEFGVLVITTSIIPHVAYADGLNKMMTHLSPLDFYTPEFDNLGVQAITRRELSNKIETVAGTFNNLAKTFGFVPRYSEYKHSDDIVSGQFRSHRIFDQTTLNSYLFKYQYNVDEMTETDTFMNKNLLFGDQQFDNIFNYSQTDVDHFHLVHHITLHCYRPMSSLSDTLPIPGTGEVSTPYNGITIN